jgi:hypothetical protein
VTEERQFTRAAGRLGIKQPPLCLQIWQLDQELGAVLFTRLMRGVDSPRLGLNSSTRHDKFGSRRKGERRMFKVGHATMFYTRLERSVWCDFT